jgi:hypothetical protein
MSKRPMVRDWFAAVGPNGGNTARSQAVNAAHRHQRHDHLGRRHGHQHRGH